MQRIKRFFGMVYLDTGKFMDFLLMFGTFFLILSIVLFIIRRPFLTPQDLRWLIIPIVSLILVLLFRRWGRKLPEYFIMKAEKIFKEDKRGGKIPIYTYQLDLLVKLLEKSGSKTDIQGLKNFLEEVKKYRRKYKRLEEIINRLKCKKNTPKATILKFQQEQKSLVWDMSSMSEETNLKNDLKIVYF